MSTPTRFLLRCILSVAFGESLGACASAPIFRADFDNDTVGEQPNPSPPGSPSGDTIWSSSGGNTTTFSVVHDDILRSRSARLANAGSAVRMVGFIPVDLSSTADHVYASWRGVINDARAPLEVWLGDAHFVAIGGLRFKEGEVQVTTSRSDFETIGSYKSNISHFVIITLNKTQGTFGVSLVQRNNTVSRFDVRVLNLAAAQTIRPTLYVSYHHGGSDLAHYVIDEIIISAREPEL
jgi:hypothetical protein